MIAIASRGKQHQQARTLIYMALNRRNIAAKVYEFSTLPDAEGVSTGEGVSVYFVSFDAPKQEQVFRVAVWELEEKFRCSLAVTTGNPPLFSIRYLAKLEGWATP